MNWLADQQLAELSLQDIKANFLCEWKDSESGKALVEIKYVNYKWTLPLKTWKCPQILQ